MRVFERLSNGIFLMIIPSLSSLTLTRLAMEILLYDRINQAFEISRGGVVSCVTYGRMYGVAFEHVFVLSSHIYNLPIYASLIERG